MDSVYIFWLSHCKYIHNVPIFKHPDNNMSKFTDMDHYAEDKKDFVIRSLWGNEKELHDTAFEYSIKYSDTREYKIN